MGHGCARLDRPGPVGRLRGHGHRPQRVTSTLWLGAAAAFGLAHGGPPAHDEAQADEVRQGVRHGEPETELLGEDRVDTYVDAEGDAEEQPQGDAQAHEVEQAQAVDLQEALLEPPAGADAGAEPDPQLGVMTSQAVAAEAVAEWSLWSTTARVVVRDPAMLGVAVQAVESELAGMERAASRFRPDSEVALVAAADGRPTRVSPLLAATIRAALRVAEATDGAVDPTLGRSLVAAGYDADFPLVKGRAAWPPVPVSTEVLASWRDVHLVGDLLTLPAGVLLDLGATGKALAVDRAAVRASIAAHGPVLVAVGGDLRAAGTLPDEPWLVELAERPSDPGVAWIHVTDGGIATSTTTSRRWRSGDRWAHHVLDPSTGRPADVHWRTATVAAATCVDANAASTAALVKGAAAEGWLRANGLPARLVHRDGDVRVLGGWPEREAA